MEMLNRAIEDAALFEQMIERIEKSTRGERQFTLVVNHVGENRAERRARLRAEKSAARRSKRALA